MTTPKDEWLPIPIEGYSCYEWNECLGLVRSWKNNKWGRLQVPKVMRAQTSVGGYKSWHLTSDIDGGQHNISLHVLVCTQYHGARPNGMCVCHGDGNPTNNSPDNLRWDSPRANLQDSVRHGVRTLKLSTTEVASIRSAPKETSQVELARRFDVCPSMISMILSGKRLREMTYYDNCI